MAPPPPLTTTSAVSFAWGPLLDASSDLLALLDLNGRLLWVNAGFEHGSGHRWQDVEGASAIELLGAGTLGADGWDAVRTDLNEGRGFDAVELPWRDRAGSDRWGRLSVQRLDRAAGSGGPHWLMALHDLSEVRALAAQARRLSEVLETAQEFGRLGTWECKLPHGEERWDRQMYRFFGLDPKDGAVDFAHVAQHMHADASRPGDDYRQSFRRAGKYSRRYRIEVPGQPVRHVHAQWEVKNSAAGIPALLNGIMMDDTEAYTLAQSFNKASAQLRLAVELGNISIWRQDLQTGLLYFDERSFEVVSLPHRAGGVTREELRALIHPDDLAQLKAAEQQSLATDRPVDTEARYRRADGTWRYVLTRRRVVRDERGMPREFVGVSLDVTEQVEKNRLANEMARRLEVAAAASGMGIWSRDPVTRKVEWNAQMYELMGRPESLGLPTRDEWLDRILHPEDRDRMRTAHIRMMTSNGPMPEDQFRIRRPDGSVRWLVNRSRQELRDGHTVQFGITLDVTDRVTREAERQEKQMALRESQAKSEFLSRMSHELRTPLNAVLGFAQLLSLGGQLDHGQRDKVSRIHSAGEHLLSLINDVLDISSLDQGQLRVELEPVHMASVLREALPMVESLAQLHGVSLHVEVASGVAHGDRTRIRQVMINLLSNAIKYNRANGKVVISCEDEGAEVVLRVQDTGRGMSPGQLNELFEPFNRLGLEKETIPGSGIGLSLVKVLVERMGGAIIVTSEVGAGSEFAVRLPRAASAAALTEPGRLGPAVTASTMAAALTPMSPRSGKVLYIEDNPVNQILVEELVRRHVGLDIESRETGVLGVARARELKPQLILIDIQLPDIDGFEVLRRLRLQPETAYTPCIALSANAMPEDISRAAAAGFDDYWTKPIDFGKFLAAMERLFPGG
jgi:PAS domain S-box-containing protein